MPFDHDTFWFSCRIPVPLGTYIYLIFHGTLLSACHALALVDKVPFSQHIAQFQDHEPHLWGNETLQLFKKN